ncbi:uncharacterized protein LOC115693899 isoform X1 [Syzygium oleosum]|uniref:uncharacterized protein LOC115693899 isoform X1 n=1 Tax=Syzygium oleosum TaxID=219896 RepID=UPI0024B8C792|nr:uncharacterized protein LOC115693899 isoform X1 [Syzygium oleosum]
MFLRTRHGQMFFYMDVWALARHTLLVLQQQLFSSIHISERAKLLNIYIGTCEQAFFNELDGVEVLIVVFVLAGIRITDLLDAAPLRPGRLEDFCSVIFLLYRRDWISLKFYQGR